MSMVTRNLALSVLLLAFFSFSCARYVADSDCVPIIPANTIPIKADISELVDSITYVQLETDQRCLLGLIDKVIYADNHLFVKSLNGLFVFEQNGAFVSEIGKRGRGPNEYLHIDAFFVDEQKGEVAIICSNKQRILYYDYDGQFIRSVGFNSPCTGIIHHALSLPDGSILANYKLSSYHYPTDALYRHISFNSIGAMAELIFPSVDLDTDKKGINSYLYSPMVEYKSEILALLPISNRILSFEEGRMNAKYKVVTPKTLPDKQFVKKEWKGSVPQFVASAISAGFSPGIQSVYSSDDYLFLKIGNDIVVWDGCDSVILGNVSDMAMNIAGGALFSGISDACWGVYEAGFLLNVEEKISVTQLASIIERLSDDSNPVVFRYHFKDDLIKNLD